MSASLVGSEMCIRDSIWPPRTATSPRAKETHAVGNGPLHAVEEKTSKGFYSVRRDLQLEELREHGAIVRLEDQIVQEPLEQEALQREIVPVQAPEPPLSTSETPPGPVRIRIVLPSEIPRHFLI